MTERPMWDGGPADHPDEGTIHAWLDDALDGDSAGRVAAHVATCAECAARVAEARGLIAGASRIVAALDDSPATARPPWAQVATASSPEGGASVAGARVDGPAGASLWRWLRVTPARAAIAATILGAVGVRLTHDRVAEESARSGARPTVAVHDETEPRRGTGGGAAGGSPASASAPMVAPAPAPASARDEAEATDSSATHDFAKGRSGPTIERAPGPEIPQPPAVASTEPALEPAREARERVAIGRAAVQAQRETTARADKLRTDVTAAEADARSATQEIADADAAARAGVPASAPSAAKAAPRGADATGNVAAMTAPQRRLAVGKECYRMEGVLAGTRWAGELLPVLVIVEPGSGIGARAATIRPPAVAEPSRRATWTRTAADSVRLALDDGSSPPVLIGADAGGRAGSIGGRAEVRVRRVECGGGASVR